MRRLPAELLNGYDDQAAESYLGLAGSEAELQDMIDYLMDHREHLKDSALTELEAETSKLLERLEVLKREELVVQLECFKDTLALQRRRLEHEKR